jgi:hypothetical protein
MRIRIRNTAAESSVADLEPFYTDADLDPASHFDTDPDPALSVGPPGPNRKAYFVKFSLPVNFVVLIRVAQ